MGAKRNHRYKKSKWGRYGPGPFLRRNRPSIHQLAKPQAKRYRNKWPRGKIWLSGALKGAPHKKGVVTKVYIKNPKKPNSANRKVFSDRARVPSRLPPGPLPGAYSFVVAHAL